MSVSQPSREVYVINVPEIADFSPVYLYNFFVPDESVNDTGGIPASVLARPADSLDASFMQYAVTRIPRLVQFSFTPARLADVGNLLSEQSQLQNSLQSSGDQDGSLIINNLNKVVNEDQFSAGNYVAVQFHDGQIDEKVYRLVSGSIVQQMVENNVDQNNSMFKLAQGLIAALPESVKPIFVTHAMDQPQLVLGSTFYVPAAGSGMSAGGLSAGGTRAPSTWFDGLKQVGTNVQMNSRLMFDLVDRSIKDPTSTAAGDLVQLHAYAKQAQQAINQRLSTSVSEQDYKSFVSYVSVEQQNTALHSQKYAAEIVGYIIDKFEVLPGGATQAHPPIVIDNPHVSLSADFQVKFNAMYCYCIRTIALLTMPAIDDDTGAVATVKVLVSSKPSGKTYISTKKLDAPPPPGDVDFIWNYETNQLLVTWAFPVTSERDVKQFQVFRRDSTDHPFELQKVYDFDDSVVRFPSNEDPDPRVVEKLTSPATFWIDGEFDWNVNTSRSSSKIYSVCAIDAHSLTSNYSAQFRVWFDRFQNALLKELVSHVGAPKAYPNLYLEGNLVSNTIRVSGDRSKTAKLYLNPEHYYTYDAQGRYSQTLATKQVNGAYKVTFMNMDNLQNQSLDITIDDQTQQSLQPVSDPIVRFGPRRKPTPVTPA